MSHSLESSGLFPDRGTRVGPAAPLAAAPSRRAATRSPAIWLLAALMLVQLALNLFLHAIPVLPKLGAAIGMAENYAPERAYAGILSNGFDNFSYAAWAGQAARGAWTMSDLYTAEPHDSWLFNPYFIVTGLIARATGAMPLTVMVLASLLAGPALAWLVFRLSRLLHMTRRAALLAVGLTLFATGPSLLTAMTGLSGIDGFYFDLFPATTLIAAPYQAACLVLTAAALWGVISVLRALSGGVVRPGMMAAVSALVAVLILVRPYQAGVLGLLYPACAIWVAFPGRPRALAGLAASLFIIPVLVYVTGLSFQPVWRDIARGYMLVEVTRWQIALGFSLFWAGAGFGALRAVRERRVVFLPLVLWFAVSVPAILLLGKAATKFADAAVLDYAVLAAFGLEALVVRGGLGGTAAKAMIAVACGTTLLDLAGIVHSKTPEPDRELLSIAGILSAQPGPAPTVLTDCDTGTMLPALSGARVFAGHWSLTLDYARKCTALRDAGLGGEADPRAAHRLVSEWRPDYAVVPVRTDAALYNGKLIWAGQRWELLRVSP